MPRTRKNHPPSLKAKVAVEAIKAHKTTAQIAQVFGVHPTQVRRACDGMRLFLPPHNYDLSGTTPRGPRSTEFHYTDAQIEGGKSPARFPVQIDMNGRHVGLARAPDVAPEPQTGRTSRPGVAGRNVGQMCANGAAVFWRAPKANSVSL